MEIDYISPAPGTLVRSHGGRQPAASHARVGEVSVWFYFEAGMYELCTRAHAGRPHRDCTSSPNQNARSRQDLGWEFESEI